MPFMYILRCVGAEEHFSTASTIARERQLKLWTRKNKEALADARRSRRPAEGDDPTHVVTPSLVVVALGRHDRRVTGQVANLGKRDALLDQPRRVAVTG
jgi:hypothetical protein